MITKEIDDSKRESLLKKCLPELLREQANAHPGRISVTYENESLTYRELVESSSNLAAYLQHLGVGPDDCVGIFVEPSIDLMTGCWGILFSGGAYLPLSPEYPEERLRYMIENSRTKIIVSQEALKARLMQLAPHGVTIVTLKNADDFARSNLRVDKNEFDVDLRPSNLAYVIYTSGSTGKPKGVMIEHRSIVNQMNWLKTAHRLDRDSIVLQKTPMNFDAAQWEILAPACGSKVVVGRQGVYRDPEGLIETVLRHGVTKLQCVPTLLQALVDTEKFHNCTSLTQVFSGGEALSKNLALQFLKALPECELVNLYGPTECTINSSSFTVDWDTVNDGPQAISIGAAAHNTQYHILDDRRSPVAIGEIGELYIGGVQLARGYLNRPDLTADRFTDNPFSADPQCAKLFRTGDLVYLSADGTVQFVGRADNQVKLRGFRVELDEIKLAIENHNWVKHAAVIVKNDPNTGFQNLISFIELNPKEAVLMDQGNHGAHHQSKESRVQVKAQLSNMGFRDDGEIDGKVSIDLPGKTPTREQRRLAFARKTYRFFEGGDVGVSDILRLLGKKTTGVGSRSLDELSFSEFGEILRYFGQYLSDERLLPKYSYASPGALYATQMYLEINKIGDLKPGYYYYHPVRHHLVLIRAKSEEAAPQVTIHFTGKRRAIEPVYKNNIQEVLQIETGHMVGLFEEILSKYGLGIRNLAYSPCVRHNLECPEEDYYLGTFETVPYTVSPLDDSIDIYVQAHPGGVTGLPSGQYQYKDGVLEKVSDELILKKHVIAINQQVYERSSFGITVISKNGRDWMSYVDLGKKLQRLSMNDINLGFMSSGYSSETGADLPAAKRIESILRSCGRGTGPSYFFVGGRVSDEQVRSEGMKEDAVHMKGPAEMVKDDLINLLPHYMIPNKVIVLDRLPSTPNGKIDIKAMEALDEARLGLVSRPFIAPRTRTEERIGNIWKERMRRESVSVQDDFFESGGNSLVAVGLINKVNKEFGIALPLQVIFECSTIQKLAQRVDGKGTLPSTRLVPLQSEGEKNPVYCWPGLGGYTMNLRSLVTKLDIGRPFYGVQAHGINDGETPYRTIKEMAAEDIKEIRLLQPEGPYTLWGYSFGARVAFEAAYQLEQSGEQVENLFLMAPGSPKIQVNGEFTRFDEPTYNNKAYVTILFSVFAGSISDPALDECLKVAQDDESFASFIGERFKDVDPDLVKRVAKIVEETYSFNYTFHELATRRVSAPITIFKATGDDYSFIEGSSGYSSEAPRVIDLESDHYSMLKDPGVNELVKMIRRRLRFKTEESIVPHVNIKHFPISLTEERKSALVAAVTNAVRSAFGCDEGVVSILLEPVEKDDWGDQVYIPEIVNRRGLLCKSPNY